jgi:inositol polyphosphate 5-phosphatase INPP5B/F
LNYRVGTLEDAEVKKQIQANNLEYLFKYDQLSIEKDAGRVLWGFEEGYVKFAPTYKFDPGTTNYDSSEKKRTPGWTDRILWKGRLKDKLKLLDYDCHTILISDHRPVSIFAECEVKRFVDYKLKETKEAILAIYAQTHTVEEEIDITKLISLERNSDSFTFENVRYGVDEEQILILTNNLNQKVEFEFISKEDGTDACQPWLKIHPKKGSVSPGITRNIKLTIKIDLKTYSEYNLMEYILKDELRLHLTNGPTYTIKISGNILLSCFGNSLEQLVCCPDPIRKINKSKVSFFQENLGQKMQIPKELFRLVDYIWKYGMRNASLFQEQGEEDEENFIREALDSGTPLSGFTGSIQYLNLFFSPQVLCLNVY